MAIQAIVFDLGGTLVDWPDWDDAAPCRWAATHQYLMTALRRDNLPNQIEFVAAMREAELEHWRRVEEEFVSAPPAALVREGFRRIGCPATDSEIEVALEGYARAVIGWAVPFPDAAETLRFLRERGYQIGLLSNTWWAADWHNADLVRHGLSGLLDAVVYTSELPWSKPHPLVFHEIAHRLNVEPASCVMVGDRMIDDVSGALKAGMRGVWRQHDRPWPKPTGVVPSATISHLAELPDLLRRWGGS